MYQMNFLMMVVGKMINIMEKVHCIKMVNSYMKVLSNMENMMVMVKQLIQIQSISIVYLITKILQN